MKDDAMTTPRERPEPPPGRTVVGLILFVGPGCRPSREEYAALSRAGMRSLWLAGIEQAVTAARGARFDAVVLDADLLEADPGQALPRLRRALEGPLLVVADALPEGDAASVEIDEILALELGAQAYLRRPLAPRRLRAHLLALLRWGEPRHAPEPALPAPLPSLPSLQSADAVNSAPNWQLDRVSNRLHNAARSVPLTDVQCAFLQCLLESPGRIVPRQRLASAVPQGQALHARSVDVYIHRLRKRLQESGVRNLDIESVRGRGYVLNSTY